MDDLSALPQKENKEKERLTSEPAILFKYMFGASHTRTERERERGAIVMRKWLRWLIICERDHRMKCLTNVY